jgi:hypothetical protein
VIGGPDAFLLIAKDYEDFAHAIRQKLLREIQGAGLAGRDAAGARFATIRASTARTSSRPTACCASGGPAEAPTSTRNGTSKPTRPAQLPQQRS